MKTILVDAISAFVIKGEGVFKEMYELLETYDNPKIILTGANDEQMEQFGLNQMPYPVFTLKHNPEKTGKEYFNIMLNNYKLKADEVVYFEHNAEAVKSAEAIGIKTHFYDENKKDLNALKKFLDENLMV